MAENSSSVGDDEENDGVDALRAALNRCRQPLRNLVPAPQDNDGFARSRRPAVKVAVPPERLPVPHSVALVMSLVLGVHDLGRRDKLMWEYPFTYRDRSCSISLEKSGLRLYLGLDDSSLREDSAIAGKTVEDELISKISKATRCVENKILSNIADEQSKAGHITIGNQVGQLRQMYEYFRDRASDAYAGRGPLAHEYDEQIQDAQSSPQASERIRARLLSPLLPLGHRREGLYTTIAMTYAYCSLLEHMLVLVLPAIDFDPTVESVTGFISGRNLFDKQHGTISFHVDGVGAIPRLMSNVRTHPTFHLVPERESSFDQVCALFDELDEWLRSRLVKHGVQWAESGLDVPFNPEFLTGFRVASAAGDAAFECFLRRADCMADQAANMDW